MIRNERKPPYVQSAGSLDVPPPYHFPGVTVNSFVWETQMEAVQRYCDTYFNLGKAEDRGFVYRPAAFWPYANLMFLDYPVMVSSNPAPENIGEMPYENRGIVRQTEVFVALPVLRCGLGRKAITQTEVEWALPFIAVGNPTSAVCGREMLGLGKLLASIGTGEGKYPNSFLGTVELPGWAKDCRGEMQRTRPFIRVETKPVLPTFRTSGQAKTLATLLQSREAGWMIDGLASFSSFVDRASMGLVPTTMRTVGLKQYRDAVHTDQAVYQALVTCRSRYTNIREFQFYDENDVRIRVERGGSFEEIIDTIIDTRMLGDGRTIERKPVAGFRFKADIDYDSMAVTYEFPVGSKPGPPDGPGRADLDARWYRPLKGFFGPERHR